MNSIISLKSVSKSFGDKQALDEVSLDIPPGIVFALLGENGAGKTTMIRILTGAIKPDAGTATVLGLSCHRDGETIRQRSGYVSDAPALYDWMTSQEIGWFTSAFYDEAFPFRYAEALQNFDVPAGVKIKNMSKGQRAKVALALATSHDPELLILDEPTSGLDPMVRRQFLESMVDRAALGHTVFLSSHQISEVERVADWIGILHEGKLKLVKPLQDLRESTQIITATLEHSDATVALPRGEVLTETKNARQIRWIVSNLPENWRDDFREDSGIVRIEQTTPTLEEIFVAVCDARASRPPQQSNVNERKPATESVA
ncbi:ABC transporter ATP-binding protein [Rhodopirellula sp. MGV]|uniref:ABC transporter ATP-binding protein n=1 Tax=Rhodopirellula sp. MGV TaxID=2023130 RepID=UPI000B973831|nr:ABC transporter ATP-binding protein [Rhodopirellula sp. MGV]OYP34969.1 multidrug ABC transporter ATP-binding protein [Rhodopirellula sp. MGV]PNY38135.1 ABC transporter ATP-binding protein [Rhodopirellula baltica]